MRIEFTKYITFFLLALLSITACKPEEFPEEVKENPVFYLEGKLNGQYFKYEAGADNMYMYADMNQLESGVMQYISTLGLADCEDCPGNLSFQITNSNNQLNTGNIPLDSTAYQTEYEVQFTAETWSNAGAPIQEYIWDFGDGTTSNEANPKHVFDGSQNYRDISLRVKRSATETDFISKRVYLNHPCTCRFSAQEINSNPKEFEYKVIGNISEINTVQWLSPGFGAQNGLSFIQPYNPVPNDGKDEVSLKLTYNNGCEAEDKKHILIDANAAKVIANFSYNVKKIDEEIENPAPIVVNIVYVDAQGNRFESNANNQESYSYFEILSLEDFDTNELGHKTQKAEISFGFQLFSGNRSLLLENGKGVIAVVKN